MTKMDDQLLADELHALFDEKSAQGAPVVDRPAGVRRRVARHKRVRTLSAMVVVLLAGAGAAGVVTAAQHHANPAPPAVKPSPSTPPGTLPAYSSGGHLATSVTIDLREQQTGSADLHVGRRWTRRSSATCVASDIDIWVAVKMNGHDRSKAPAAAQLRWRGHRPRGVARPATRVLVASYGVALGAAVTTITFEVGKHVDGRMDSRTSRPVLTTGGAVDRASTTPVPFDQYPLPPKPADWTPNGDSMGMSPPDGMHKL